MSAQANPFTAKSVPARTIAELDTRKNLNALNAWYASRSNWVSIISFCDACLPQVISLFGLRDPAYENGSFLGMRPNPIVESVQVKGQGNLGTTRTCTVKLIAFTEDQLNAISSCYCIPGMSVRVQFGWNADVNGNLAPSPFGTKENDSQATCRIGKLRNDFACYDGIQGKIGKWGVTFVKETMSWEVTLEIIAPSAPVMMRPLEDMNSICYCDRVSQDPEKEGEKTSQGTSNFRAIIIDMIENPSSYSNDPNVYVIHLNHAERDQLGNQPSGFFKSMGIAIADMVGTAETDETYIPFSYLEQLINDHAFSQTGEGTLEAKFDSSKLGALTYNTKKPLYSSDPDVCLFPGLDTAYDGGLDGVEKAPSCLITTTAPFSIDAGKILINCIFLNKCIENLGPNSSIQDFMSAVLEGINTTAGGLFELSIIDSGDCDDGSHKISPILSVIDLQKIKKQGVPVYTVTGGAASSVLRDVRLELKLTDAMKAQALYAGERKTSNSSPCDEARFKNELKGFKNKTLPSPINAPKTKCPEDCKTKEEHEKEKPTLYADYLDMVSDTTSGHKETVRTRLVEQWNESATTDNCKEVIVPYEFSFTVDGIGGFQFGQLVTCNLLPKRIIDTFVFQVTAVEHSITYGDWTTTVNTVARYK